jgi:hypothetical protein
MLQVPVCIFRTYIITTVLTDGPASRHTLSVPLQSTKILGEGAWLRNLR